MFTNTVKSFGDTARALARNPLGIIALFIVLVYGIAALTLAAASNSNGLESSQLTPLIWFLVLFPVIVLIIFAWLVVRHPHKLYGPGDFRDDITFLRALTPAEQRQRLVDEFSAVATRDSDDSRDTTSGIPHTSEPARHHSRTFMNAALAEDLVLRELASEYASTIRRQVKVEMGADEIFFDGILTCDKELIGVEVAYFEANIAPLRFDALTEMMRRAGNARLRAVLAIVFRDELLESQVEQSLADMRAQLGDSNSTIDIRKYSFNALCRKYGLDLGSENTREDGV